MDAEQKNVVFGLIDAKRLIQEFKANLPKKIYAASLGIPSKIPFKALSLRDGLIHRLADLSDIACNLYEQNRIVPAIIMVRAVMETTAMLYLLYTKVDRVVKTQQLENIDKFLMRAIFGWRDETMPEQALNILNAADTIDKKFKGFRRLYDELSEFVHPNWSGTAGAYADMIKDKFEVDLGAECSALSPETGLPALGASLECFKYYYNALADIMPSFVQICHTNATNKGPNKTSM